MTVVAGWAQGGVTLVVSLAAYFSHLACLAEEVLHLCLAGLEAHVAHKHSLGVVSGHSRGMAIALRALHHTTMQHTFALLSSQTCCKARGGQGAVLGP